MRTSSEQQGSEGDNEADADDAGSNVSNVEYEHECTETYLLVESVIVCESATVAADATLKGGWRNGGCDKVKC